jgi:zinc D-Ala-D-Ala carboxypeptidase
MTSIRWTISQVLSGSYQYRGVTVTRLTKNFSLVEFTSSQTARSRGLMDFQNNPPLSVIGNLQILSNQLLQPIRDVYGSPIIITSGYRSRQLNAILPGASPNSDHLFGNAADFKGNNMARLLHATIGVCRGRPFHQLIIYHDKNFPSWIHISLRMDKVNSREYSFVPRSGRRVILGTLN